MFDITAIASAHNIEADELNKWVVGRGWNFSTMDDSNAQHVEFATGVVAGYAKQIADHRAKIEAARAKRLACEPVRTAAAQKHPEAICYKCDGKGRIRGFGHIEGGKCFACGGAGVRRVRGQK